MRSDDRVARARDDAGIRIDLTHLRPKLANETIANAGEITSPGFFELEIVEQTPCGEGNLCEGTAANATEPTHQQSRIASGNPVGDEKVDVFLKKDLRQGSGCTPVSFHCGE